MVKVISRFTELPCRSRWEGIHPSLQQLQELLQTKAPSPFQANVPLSSVLKSRMLATPRGCWPGCPRICEPNEKAAEKQEMAHCVPKMSMCDEILEVHHQRRVTDYWREPKGLASYCFQIIAETKKGLCRHAHSPDTQIPWKWGGRNLACHLTHIWIYKSVS